MHNCSQKEAAEAALSDGAAPLDPSMEDSFESLVRLTSMPSERPALVPLAPHSTGASSAARAGTSPSATGSMSGTSKQHGDRFRSSKMPHADDWAIKPSEIEIMTKSDGSPVLLGRGAYGEVRSPWPSRKLSVKCRWLKQKPASMLPVVQGLLLGEAGSQQLCKGLATRHGIWHLLAMLGLSRSFLV